MTDQEYLEQRLDNRINWYDKKSEQNQKYYRFFRNSELIFSASISLILVAYTPEYRFFKFIIGLLSVAITIIAGILSLYKYHENWIEYRSIRDSLYHEKYMFLTRAGIYDSENPFQTLVERVESILSHENFNWAQLNRRGK